MANHIYETAYKNLDEGGYYYRGSWYATEAELNENGYYIVYDKTLYLGTTGYSFRYQHNLYLVDGEYVEYQDLHIIGYSMIPSQRCGFSEIATSDYFVGYSNEDDGYYIANNWYETEQDLNNAGYILGTPENVSYNYFLVDTTADFLSKASICNKYSTFKLSTVTFENREYFTKKLGYFFIQNKIIFKNDSSTYFVLTDNNIEYTTGFCYTLALNKTPRSSKSLIVAQDENYYILSKSPRKSKLLVIAPDKSYYELPNSPRNSKSLIIAPDKEYFILDVDL